MFDLNLNNTIGELCSCLNKWQKHNVTLIGKIKVIKTFRYPKIMYPFAVPPSPLRDADMHQKLLLTEAADLLGIYHTM